MIWRWNRKPVVVTTCCGNIAGQLEYCKKSGRYVTSFRAIPYAKPPIGNLRWRAPEPPEKWKGILDCSAYSPEAPQLGVDFMCFFESAVVGHGFSKFKTKALISGIKIIRHRMCPLQSEDCLYLNIRVSFIRHDSIHHRNNLPVLLYFHGGDHHDCSGGNRPYYRPYDLITMGDVVLVTFNYRLGIFGHFTHPDLNQENIDAGGQSVSGNYSFLDQIAALKWIKCNISKLDGNPDCVRICGSSAGGKNILYMMISPLARGLFHRATSQSPANTSNSLMHLKHRFSCFQPSELNGFHFATRAVGYYHGQISRMRKITVDDLQALHLADATFEPQPKQLFFPVIDGVILPKSPIEAFWAGEQAPVPFLIWFNWDGGSLCFPVTKERTFLRDHLYPRPVRPLGRRAYGNNTDKLINLYDSSWPERSSGLLCIIARVIQSAFHGAEVPYIFGAKPWLARRNYEDIALSEAMVDYWSAFARTGNPNLTKERRVDWPVFNLDTYCRLILDHKMEVRPMERLDQYSIMHQHVYNWILEMRLLRSDSTKNASPMEESNGAFLDTDV